MDSVHIWIVARVGAPEPDIAGCDATLMRVPELDDTSSTAVRAALTAHDKNAAGLARTVHLRVLEYIQQQGLYGVDHGQ